MGHSGWFSGSARLSRVLANGLGQLGVLDPVICGAVALLLGSVALLASYLPARKALRVNPVDALRCD